ncbi:hypothetical protein GTA51_07050 [Desulfovibrio aerotolerans]|uniref:Band 7 domain-containing protein n=2 Tax=Solidesulfovibrio aerotolerans TaxID=295255 RepID=A0A7C9MUQ6_9BACT|nr:hypothetical protein [Solidesulfovibrio aerotolerans]
MILVYFSLAMWLMGFIILYYIIKESVVLVGGMEIAVLERRWLGRNMPQGRVVARKSEVGVQARTLGPGLHFLIPFLYKATKSEFLEIGTGAVGLVESIDGNPVPPGNIFAKEVAGHDAFQDGEAFLENEGEKGPQIQILPPGKYRINPFLFSVGVEPAVEIPQGKIGMVTAQDGAPIDTGRLLAKRVAGHSNFENGRNFLEAGGQKGPQIDILLPGTYRINTKLFTVVVTDATVIEQGMVGLVTALDGVPLPEQEFVAKSVAGHSDFQNAQAFLDTGGQRGPQLDVLRPGTYYINPMMFQVSADSVTVVERGQVAVVVSNVGEEPTQEVKIRLGAAQAARPQGGGFQEVYVVPKGYRGIQEEVAGPGRYYLNRRAFIPYIVDTTNITIDWDDAKDTRFDPLKVISKDGFTIGVSVKVVVRVRPDQAPYMVAKVGSIDNLIIHVVHPMIDSSFRNQASATSAMNFMQDRQDEQKKAEDRTKSELEKYHVECVSVLICQITLPQDLMDTQTKKIIAQQEQAQYTEQQKAEQARIATEKTRAEADQQKVLVASEINVKVAEQNRQATIKSAEAEGEALRLKAEGEAKGITAKGEAEGNKILAVGEATAKAFELQGKVIGGSGLTAIALAERIKDGQIKVTPDVLVQGSGAGELGGLLAAFLVNHMTKAVTPAGATQPLAPSMPQEATAGDAPEGQANA